MPQTLKRKSQYNKSDQIRINKEAISPQEEEAEEGGATTTINQNVKFAKR